MILSSMNNTRCFLVFTLLFTMSNLVSQSILIDEGYRVNGLWCFPMHNSPDQFKYLPNEIRLSTAQGLPQFSFMQYVINTEENKEIDKAITKAAGGAIVNFILELYTDEEKIKAAEKALQQKLGKNKKLTGPVIFNKGVFALVSSILTSKGTKGKELVGCSETSVLEGGRVPVSYKLSPDEAAALIESLKMSTPDVSFLFDFSFSGLTRTFDGEININWSQLYEHTHFKSRYGVPFFKKEVEKTIEEFEEKKFIEVTNNGSNEEMEEFQKMAYEKVTDLLFRPVSLNEFRSNRTGWANDLLSILESGSTIVGFNSGYQFKKIEKNNIGQLVFKGRGSSIRHHVVTFNIGDLFKQYGDDERFFKTVNLTQDKDFLQREVVVGLDGALINDFDKILNNVTIFFRKVHKSGEQTISQCLFRKGTFDNILESTPRFIYGNLQDEDLLEWLNYEYKTIWHFQGGARLETPWTITNEAIVNLFAPYQSRKILIGGNLQQLWKQDIKSIAVKISYDFFGKSKRPIPLIIQESDNLSEKYFEIICPLDTCDIDYQINWYKEDNHIVKMNRKDTIGIIFIDDPPL